MINNTLHYLRNQIETSSDEKIITMLLDRCIVSIKEAAQAILKKQYDERFNNITKAIDIISYLLLSVDTDKGGDVAKNLIHIYKFCLDRLSQVDIENNHGAAMQVIEILEPIRYAYRELSNPKRASSGVTAEVKILPLQNEIPGL